jgi:transcriptional regulator with XRE-family HTH domain
MAFGQVVRKLRLEQGLSQEELAHQSGYHRNYIGILERGEKSASLEAIFSLAGALAVAPSLLMSLTETITGRQFPKTS